MSFGILMSRGNLGMDVALEKLVRCGRPGVVLAKLFIENALRHVSPPLHWCFCLLLQRLRHQRLLPHSTECVYAKVGGT